MYLLVPMAGIQMSVKKNWNQNMESWKSSANQDFCLSVSLSRFVSVSVSVSSVSLWACFFLYNKAFSLSRPQGRR